MYYIGVMSGTSCDGIDVALVDFKSGSSTETEVIAAHTSPYPDDIRSQLLSTIADQPTPVSVISQLDAKLGFLYAESINKLLAESSICTSDITAIGLHGQTIHHQPPQYDLGELAEFANTIQLGSAAITAQQTGITVVANFRQMDVANGGQGAPLAPILHKHLFNTENKTTVVLNLGGIANITVLKNNAIIGFDTGPASCLMDEHIQDKLKKPYDESGQWAQQGQINNDLLNAFLTDGYFTQSFPKSTGREYFNLSWLKHHLASHQIKAVDVQRTLLQLTAESIALGIEQVESDVDQMVVCGGGVHNRLLMQAIKQRFNFQVLSSADIGINPDYVEATLMAWLAKLNVLKEKLDLSEITGCKVPHVYGVQFKSY